MSKNVVSWKLHKNENKAQKQKLGNSHELAYTYHLVINSSYEYEYNKVTAYKE